LAEGEKLKSNILSQDFEGLPGVRGAASSSPHVASGSSQHDLNDCASGDVVVDSRRLSVTMPVHAHPNHHFEKCS
jgi:hypothetical protein